MIKLIRFRFSSISQLIHNLSSKEKDTQAIDKYQSNLLQLQDKIHQQIKDTSLNHVIEDQLKQRSNPFDIYNYYMLLRFLNLEHNNDQCFQLLSYIYDSMQIQKNFADKDIIFALLQQQIKESERKLAFKENVPIKYLFNMLHLFTVLFGSAVIPLKSIEILTERILILSEVEFTYTVQGTHTYVQQQENIFPQQFWKSFFEACDKYSKTLQTNSHTRRKFLEIVQISPKLVNYSLYEKVIKYELDFLKSSDHINLNQMITLLKTVNIIHIEYPNNIPHIKTFKQLLENQDIQRQLLNQIKQVQNTGVQHLITFVNNQQIQFDGLFRLIEQINIQQLDSGTNDQTSLMNIDTKNVNANISLLLKQGLKDLSQEEKSQLRGIIIKIFDNEMDDNTLKKLMVLACQLYPDDIKMVQLSFRKARDQIQSSSGTKADVSLAINALFQMQKVQYNLPLLSRVFVEYIVKQLSNDKDLVFTLNPQEISSIYYYISKQVQKQNKTELLIKEQEPQKIDESILIITELLQVLVPQLQFLCSKNLLKLKVLYTIIDCYSKYRKYLQEMSIQYDLQGPQIFV